MRELALMHEWKLTRAEAGTVIALRDAPGHRCTYHQIHRVVSRGSFTGSHVVMVVMCRLRKKLAQFGIKIDTLYGSGYALNKLSIPVIDAIMKQSVAEPERVLA